MYKITKSYENQPSLNNPTYLNGIPYLDTAVNELDDIARNWVKSGGSIASKTQTELTVEEGSGENRITFKITEE